jgi:hypothetical protein
MLLISTTILCLFQKERVDGTRLVFSLSFIPLITRASYLRHPFVENDGFCERMSQVASTASFSCMIETKSLEQRDEHVPFVLQSSSEPRENSDRVGEVGHFGNGCAS